MLRRVVLLVLLGCSLLALVVVKWYFSDGQGPVVKNAPIARVYDQFLYKSDLDHLATETTSPEDRAEMIDGYIQSWIAKQLLVVEAKSITHTNKKILSEEYLIIAMICLSTALLKSWSILSSTEKY